MLEDRAWRIIVQCSGAITVVWCEKRQFRLRRLGLLVNLYHKSTLILVLLVACWKIFHDFACARTCFEFTLADHNQNFKALLYMNKNHLWACFNIQVVQTYTPEVRLTTLDMVMTIMGFKYAVSSKTSKRGTILGVLFNFLSWTRYTTTIKHKKPSFITVLTERILSIILERMLQTWCRVCGCGERFFTPL